MVRPRRRPRDSKGPLGLARGRESGNPPALTAATALRTSAESLRELHREYHRSQDPAIGHQLVEAHTGLAYRLAMRFANRGEQHDDLMQVAMLGLVKALQGF